VPTVVLLAVDVTAGAILLVVQTLALARRERAASRALVDALVPAGLALVDTRRRRRDRRGTLGETGGGHRGEQAGQDEALRRRGGLLGIDGDRAWRMVDTEATPCRV
jgi:hypothetical protein